MNKYFPNKSELNFLFIGVLTGTLLTAWVKYWVVIAVYAPIIIFAWLVRYVFDKREEDFQKQLAKAKNPKALLKDEKTRA